MNKGDLVSAVAKKTELPKRQVQAVLNAVLDEIIAALKKGESVRLAGFGTFAVAERNERTGRNPRTGKPMKIPARKVVRFKPAANLKTLG